MHAAVSTMSAVVRVLAVGTLPPRAHPDDVWS